MALIKYGPIAQEVSGTIGGCTFARIRQGKAVRGWRAPTDKRRAPQLSWRSHIARFSGEWYSVLSQDQRNEWDAYAPSCIFSNPLGEDYTITGFNHFCRLQAVLQSTGVFSPTYDAPTEPGFPPAWTYDFVLQSSTGKIILNGVTGSPSAEDSLFVWVHNWIRSSRRFPNSPIVGFTHIEALNAIPPPVDVWTYIPAPPPVEYLSRAFIRTRYYDIVHNRLSRPVNFVILAS